VHFGAKTLGIMAFSTTPLSMMTLSISDNLPNDSKHQVSPCWVSLFIDMLNDFMLIVIVLSVGILRVVAPTFCLPSTFYQSMPNERLKKRWVEIKIGKSVCTLLKRCLFKRCSQLKMELKMKLKTTQDDSAFFCGLYHKNILTIVSDNCKWCLYYKCASP